MRSNFQIQPQLNIVPIEKIKIPTNSRDQLAPILLALQWIYTTPEISRQIFELLEQKILPGKSKDKGRPRPRPLANPCSRGRAQRTQLRL